MDQIGQRHAYSISGNIAPRVTQRIAQEQQEATTSDESEEQQSRVATSVLREPDVMVGDGEDGRGEQRLAPRRHPLTEPDQRAEARDAQADRGKPERPRSAAEENDRDPRQDRIQQMLILTVERGNNVTEREPHVVDVRLDLIEPEASTERRDS